MSGDLTGHCLYMADFVVLRRPVTNLVTALNNLDKLTNGLFITEFFDNKWIIKFSKSNLLASCCQNSFDSTDRFSGVPHQERDVTQLRHRGQEPHVVGQPVHVFKNAEVILQQGSHVLCISTSFWVTQKLVETFFSAVFQPLMFISKLFQWFHGWNH